MKRIVCENDISEFNLGEAFIVVKEHLDEALGRYDTRSFVQYGSFYFIDKNPTFEDCLSMGFEENLSEIQFDYTDEIHISNKGKERILLNATYIFEETDYVISVFAFEDVLSDEIKENLRKYVDVKTYRDIS